MFFRVDKERAKPLAKCCRHRKNNMLKHTGVPCSLKHLRCKNALKWFEAKQSGREIKHCTRSKTHTEKRKERKENTNCLQMITTTIL